MSERQRQHPRVSLPRVLVRIGRSHTLRQHFLEDLAEGGLFIRTHQLLPVGSELALSLTVPGEAEPLELHGRVVRVNPGTTDSDVGDPVGMGIRFEGLTPIARERLLVLLAEHSMTPALVAELGRVRAQLERLDDELGREKEAQLASGLKARLQNAFAAMSADLGSLQRAVEGLSRRVDQVAAEREEMEEELLALRSKTRTDDEIPAATAAAADPITDDVELEDSWLQVQDGETKPANRRVVNEPEAVVPPVDVELEEEDTWVEVFTFDDSHAPQPVPSAVPLGASPTSGSGLKLVGTSKPSVPMVPTAGVIPSRAEVPLALSRRNSGVFYFGTEESSAPRPLRPEDWRDAVSQIPTPMGNDVGDLPFDPLEAAVDAAPLYISPDTPLENLVLDMVGKSALPGEPPWANSADREDDDESVEVDLNSVTSEININLEEASEPDDAHSLGRSSGGSGTALFSMRPMTPPVLTPAESEEIELLPEDIEALNQASATPQPPPEPKAPVVRQDRPADLVAFLSCLRSGDRIIRTKRFHMHTPQEPMVLTVMNWLESVDTLAQLRASASGRVSEERIARIVFELYKRSVVDLSPNA